MSHHFDEAVRELIALSKKIIQSKEENNPFATKKDRKNKNPILRNLENYEQDYAINDDEGNMEDVTYTYKKFKSALLKGWKNDSWLRTGTVNIYSGAIEPDEKRKLMLSAIYSLACRLRDQSKEALSGLPLESFQGHEELLYPSYFQLHMYRMFAYALDGEEYQDDITRLTEIIRELEKELNITAGNNGQPANQESEFSLANFTKIAKDLATKMGTEIDGDFKFPDIDLSKMVNSIVNSQEVKELFSEIGETVKDDQDLTKALPKLVSKIQNSNVINQFQKMLSKEEVQTNSE